MSRRSCSFSSGGKPEETTDLLHSLTKSVVSSKPRHVRFNFGLTSFETKYNNDITPHIIERPLFTMHNV